MNRHAAESDRICSGICDHCVPDAYHPCQRPADHAGYHSCEVS